VPLTLSIAAMLVLLVVGASERSLQR